MVHAHLHECFHLHFSDRWGSNCSRRGTTLNIVQYSSTLRFLNSAIAAGVTRLSCSLPAGVHVSVVHPPRHRGSELLTKTTVPFRRPRLKLALQTDGMLLSNSVSPFSRIQFASTILSDKGNERTGLAATCTCDQRQRSPLGFSDISSPLFLALPLLPSSFSVFSSRSPSQFSSCSSFSSSIFEERYTLWRRGGEVLIVRIYIEGCGDL